jgi:hypothetical protein
MRNAIRCLPLVVALVSAGCVSLRQTDDQVAVRPPGARIIAFLAPVQPHAERHLDYARLSFVAYETTDGGVAAEAKAKAETMDRAGCPDPETSLKASGWARWDNFPPKDTSDKVEASHLRVEVWQKDRPFQVVVTFGGTVFDNRNDWLANFRWFIPFHDDQYTQVVKTLLPAFVSEFKRRLGNFDSIDKMPVLITTGHSLGGGLAQQFAYALPLNQGVPKVSVVYAFHPSPVTGYFSVPSATRDENTKGLVIERIYERHEILALLRSLQSVVLKPSDANPEMTGYRYSVVHSLGAIGNHSLGTFTCNLSRKVLSAEKK